LPFERPFKSIEHSDALSVSFTIRFVDVIVKIALQLRYEKVVYGLGRFGSATIHAFDLVAYMSIAVFLS
jgi:hypothetical protein